MPRREKSAFGQLFIDALKLVLIPKIDLNPAALALPDNPNACSEREPKLLFGRPRVRVGPQRLLGLAGLVFLAYEGLGFPDRQTPGNGFPRNSALSRFVGEAQQGSSMAHGQAAGCHVVADLNW